MVRWIPRHNPCLCTFIDGFHEKCLLCTIGCTCRSYKGPEEKEEELAQCPWCQTEDEAGYRTRVEGRLIKYKNLLKERKEREIELGEMTGKMNLLVKLAQECLWAYDENMEIDYERAVALRKMIKVLLRLVISQVTF